MDKRMHSETISKAMQAVLQNTNDFMFVKDKDLIYVGASKSFAIDCAGHTCVEEILGHTDFEIFADQKIAQKYRDDDEEMFSTNEDKIEYREEYPSKGGRKRYCLTTKYLVRDEEGNPAGIFGKCQDITEQVELELINQNDINRKIANALNSVFYASYFGNLQDQTFTILRGKEYAVKLLENCNDIKTGFSKFINEMVKPEDADKMKSFCDIDTLVSRMQKQNFIECEYRGNYVDGWCKASCIPVDYNDAGEVIHFLFVVSSIDEAKVKELEEGVSTKKSLEDMYDKMPGGIVVYKWDGKKLRTLNISKYYADQYGDSMDNQGSPDYQRIHPDDLTAYQQAIYQALTETHKLEYIYRVWNKELNRYIWTQIHAVSEVQPDGTSLVYAMYSDVTKQKEAEQLLRKRTASLVSALNASRQLCYEYDPQTHVEECLTYDYIFHMPQVIENYPESVLDIVHPDDQDKFLETIHSIDSGRVEASCNIRLKVKDKYVWYAYQLYSMYDLEKERIIALLSIMDNSEHVTTLMDYEERMKAMLGVAEASLTLGTMNVSRNTYSVVYAKEHILRIAQQSERLEDIFAKTVLQVVGPKEQEIYRTRFSRENLLLLASQGQMNVQMDHLYRMEDNHLEWVRTCVDMIKNPQTGDVTGVCYAKSIQEETIKDAILEKILQADYPVLAILYAESGECYLFESAKDSFCKPMKDYWKVAQEALPQFVDSTDFEKLHKFTNKENVLKKLENKDEYVHTFNSHMTGKEGRIELRYTYVDREHGLIMLSMRNITDATLLKKYKHDSEHDTITGLLNRRALFVKCRRLIEEHPEEQFVMFHADIKNFHLYNTFFGEDEGDCLLKYIADLIRMIDKDYVYCAYGRIEADIFAAFFPMKEELLRKRICYLQNEIPKTYNDFLVEPNFGIYVVTDPLMPIESMFSRSSIAAKSNNKQLYGCVSLFTEQMEKTLNDNQSITQEMHKAIEEEQFAVYLQPKYSLRTEEIVGSEALVRWIHPVHGMISPGRFIPVFESNGFIVELDHYMWEHVCRMICRWKQEGKPIYPVSVNVSRVSMYSQGTVSYLKKLVTRYGVEPQYLELELTETAYMDDPEEIKSQLKELQDFGFHILMDDFGSGYSSLNMLRELPVDVLKLDMKFLTESSKDLRGNIVMSSVVRMSKLLELPIVAEGVETAEQATYLRSIGCEYVQGYYFAKPMPVEEYENKLPGKIGTVVQEEKQDMEHIYRHLSVPTSSVGAVSPVPVGFLEFQNDTFTFLRLNQQFFEEFDLNKDLSKVSNIFRTHLDDKNYDVLISAFAKCAKTFAPVTFKMYWKDNDEGLREYAGRVHYEGHVGNLANMAVAFMNLTQLENI